MFSSSTGDTGGTDAQNNSSWSDIYDCLVLTLQEDVFKLKALDIGKVSSVTVGHSIVGRGRGWYCAGICLRVGDSKNQLLFPCDRSVAVHSTGCSGRKPLQCYVNVSEILKDLK